jgi:hypothetical protein
MPSRPSRRGVKVAARAVQQEDGIDVKIRDAETDSPGRWGNRSAPVGVTPSAAATCQID